MGATASGAFALESLRVEGFRNLEDATFRPAPGINVVFGANGQGKTSLLEAIYFVSTTKSFRTARAKELVQHGRTSFGVKARFVERRGDLPALSRDQSTVFEAGTVHPRIDGDKPASIAAYAVRAPIVVFHPEELALSTGPAALRRRLLDRIALYRAPLVLPALSRYAKANKARQELLRRGSHPSELDAYEDLLANAGALIVSARRQAVALLDGATREAFDRIAPEALKMTLRYRTAGAEVVEVARNELRERRERDRRAITATFGPHRDDLEIRIDDRLAREVASQGQHRMITLALKAAERAAVTEITGVEPIQLLDDVSSELDPERTAALLEFLGESRGQVFITTTRADLLTPGLTASSEPEKQYIFQLVSGSIKSV